MWIRLAGPPLRSTCRQCRSGQRRTDGQVSGRGGTEESHPVLGLCGAQHGLASSILPLLVGVGWGGLLQMECRQTTGGHRCDVSEADVEWNGWGEAVEREEVE